MDVKRSGLLVSSEIGALSGESGGEMGEGEMTTDSSRGRSICKVRQL